MMKRQQCKMKGCRKKPIKAINGIQLCTDCYEVMKAGFKKKMNFPEAETQLKIGALELLEASKNVNYNPDFFCAKIIKIIENYKEYYEQWI